MRVRERSGMSADQPGQALAHLGFRGPELDASAHTVDCGSGDDAVFVQGVAASGAREYDPL